MASASQYAVINCEILLRHPVQTERLFKSPPALGAVNGIKFLYCLGCTLYVARQKAVDAVLNDLWDPAKRKKQPRSSARPRLHQYYAKWFRPVDREQQRGSATEKFIFFRVTNFSNELNQRIIEKRLNDGVKMLLIDAIDLGCDLQRHADPLGDMNGLLQSFFRRAAAQKSQIFPRLAVERKAVFRQSMMHGPLPVHPRQWFPLRVRNRNHGHIGIRAIERGQVGDIQATVQGRNICYPSPAA